MSAFARTEKIRCILQESCAEASFRAADFSVNDTKHTVFETLQNHPFANTWFCVPLTIQKKSYSHAPKARVERFDAFYVNCTQKVLFSAADIYEKRTNHAVLRRHARILRSRARDMRGLECKEKPDTRERIRRERRKSCAFYGEFRAKMQLPAAVHRKKCTKHASFRKRSRITLSRIGDSVRASQHNTKRAVREH